MISRKFNMTILRRNIKWHIKHLLFQKLNYLRAYSQKPEYHPDKRITYKHEMISIIHKMIYKTPTLPEVSWRSTVGNRNIFRIKATYKHRLIVMHKTIYKILPETLPEMKWRNEISNLNCLIVKLFSKLFIS